MLKLSIATFALECPVHFLGENRSERVVHKVLLGRIAAEKCAGCSFESEPIRPELTVEGLDGSSLRVEDQERLSRTKLLRSGKS